MNYRKITLSASVIAFVSALVFGGTQAFFSDTETSTGNTFTAGDIDLQIDNESYAFDYNIPNYPEPSGQFVASEHTSWELTDLTVEKFFDFVDLKPGDYGEDTISIHVGSNDAWVCAAANITADDDNSITEPEDEESGSNNDNDDGTPDGDLDSELNFVFWVDDGDNVLEDDEVDNIFVEGSLDGIGQLGPIALADPEGGPFGNEPIPGGKTVYVAKAWCFGELTLTPDEQDQETTSGPLERGEDGPVTGVSCDGSAASNIAQTDSVEGDIEFYAEQARNNGDFLCSQWDPQFEGQRPAVGADLSAYSGPEQCNLTVTGESGAVAPEYQTIQGAVDAATEGQIICVEDGSYTETVVIDTPLTLASVNGPTNSATIDGGVIIDAPDVTVTGFIVLPGDTEGSTVGFYLKEPADNAVISYNEIDGTNAGAGSRGILNVSGADIDNVLIDNNHIHDLVSGIYTNPHPSDLWTISNNDIDNNTAGIGQWNGADILNNEFKHSGASQEAIGVDGSHDDNGGVVNFNNFLDGTMLNTYLGFGNINTEINAENNFWGPDGGAAQVDDTNGDVDFDPEEVSPFPHM